MPSVGEITNALLPVVTLYAGYGLRILVERIRAIRPHRLTCPCGHVISVHDAGTGRCTSSVRRKHYGLCGERAGWEYKPCDCLRYMGPGQVRQSIDVPRHRYANVP